MLTEACFSILGSEMSYILERYPEPQLDIFVSADRQQEYLNQAGIRVETLSNGITIISANSPRFGENNNHVSLEYPTGSYFDPEGKAGLLHLMEHLISNKPGFAFRRSEAGYNAATHPSKLTVEFSGVANLEVRDYGIWPALPLILTEVTSQSYPTMDQLEMEKGVIAAEIAAKVSNPFYVTEKSIGEILFQPDHPVLINVLGTRESLGNIQSQDVADVRRRALTAKGLFVDIDCICDPNSYEQLRAEIIEGLSVYPNDSPDPQVVKREVHERLADLEPGQRLIQGSNLGHNMMDVHFVWQNPVEFFTVANYAQSRFWSLLIRRFFEYSRNRGLGYNALGESAYYGLKALSSLFLRVPAIQDVDGYVDSLYTEIRDEVLGGIKDGEIQEYASLIERRLRACPISKAQREYDIKMGLQYYGRIIDTDKAMAIFSHITPQMLKDARDYLLEVPPVVIVAGDLKR